ncbi:GTP-binding protein [Veillonella caviae]|uniref:sulfate adenylyltransferase subunit 1 n=1 Tax=Veillonella caviae TaxID=248316 RepID=UPI002A8286B7|nr:GTP-binding protein [Veillonella caviae]MDY4746548.1 GTP-binding protein [Veillonella caviae]MDY5254773.1 GTP-binding protein [Veillonella caviae]
MKSLLKFITCGSVDDGKSTLIGHILYDSKLFYADQKEALELESKVGSRGGAIDYSLLLDGLMAEREQGITIDVAYRYFTTDNRSFIVADTPGHEEYTRNMAVGASFADLAIILVDAKQGVLVQTRRHARICKLMGIEYFVFAINKMDLVGYDENRFRTIEKEILTLQEELGLANIVLIPVSATEGDNITTLSQNTPWYAGQALLPYLETVDIATKGEVGFYMPVQRVSRPDHTFRGFQGQIESGSIRVGDRVTILPSGEQAEVKSIIVGFDAVTEAYANQPVSIQLNREVDVSRGCVLYKDIDLYVSAKIDTNVLWMDDSPLVEGREYIAMIGTKTVSAIISKIRYKIDVNSGELLQADELSKNEIAHMVLSLQEPVAVDFFVEHKTLGEFILIDRVSHMTSACGTIVKRLDGDKELYTFVNGTIKARGDIFEEFFYDIEGFTVNKVQSNDYVYRVGDNIPVHGESYDYPADFDIIVIRDKAAISIRNEQIANIIALRDYQYSELPILNGRGFALAIHNETDYEDFYQSLDTSFTEDWYDKWVDFGVYRRIVFKKL